MLSGMPPGKHRTAWSKKLPSPPLAWSARLSSRTFLYSGVSGASCPNPQGFVWSNEGWPPSPGTTNRAHAPFQSGYFAPSAARTPPIGSASVATAIAPNKLRQCMVTSLHGHACGARRTLLTNTAVLGCLRFRFRLLFSYSGCVRGQDRNPHFLGDLIHLRIVRSVDL